jgi:hypothetical protein
MATRDGFSIALDGPAALSEFMGLLRRDAMRVFARLYGAVLADEVARRVDGHRSGLAPGGEAASPLRDALTHLRQAHAKAGAGSPLRALDLRLRLLPVRAGFVVAFEEGHPDYRSSLLGMHGMSDLCMADARPPEVPEEEWGARSSAWEEALGGPPMGRGLVFRLVEDGLPSVRYAALVRSFPGHEARCLRTAQAIAIARGASGDGARDAIDREVRRLVRVLPRELSEEDIRAYPQPRQPQRRRPAEPPRAAEDGPRLIDHADILESSDGRIFVAVNDAGLDPDERVHIQVVDRYVSFVQGTTHFGGVPDAPYAAVEMLRRSREVFVVELRRVDGRREVKARHEALVRDDSLPDLFKLGMSGFRNSAARARRRANVQWMES